MSSSTVAKKDKHMYAAPGHDDCPVKSLKLISANWAEKKKIFFKHQAKFTSSMMMHGILAEWGSTQLKIS